jgi:hemolysin activation/secretion protein
MSIFLFSTFNSVFATATEANELENNKNNLVEPLKKTPTVDDDVAKSTSDNVDANQQESSSKEPTFDIYEFQVIGNTKLSAKQIESAVYGIMGDNKTISDVEKAREQLEKTYHETGYLTVIVDIPEQEVNHKIVKLNVTEGKVSKLRVSGSHFYSLGRIKELTSMVAEGEVPHFPTLQKQMTTLNRTADKRVTPVIKAGKVFGTVDVDLKVEDNLPLHASVELNDQYSRDTTHLRLSAMAKYDNLFQKDHSFSLSFLTSPLDFNEVRVLSANYLMRFDESDLLLAMYGVLSKSNIATVGGVNVLGDANIFGIRAIKPLPTVANYFHSISFGLDYKNFGQKTGFNGEIQTPISYMPLSAMYTGTLQESGAVTQFNTGVTLGIRSLLASDQEFDNKRSGAKPNFFVGKSELSRTQFLPKSFELFAKVDAQFSPTKLINNEQFLAGGANSVRGYLSADAQGDRAIHTTLELHSPPLFQSVSWIKEFKVHAFYDMAKLYTIDPIEIADKTAFISGIGIGANVKALKNLNASLEFAWPLNDYNRTNAGDYRTHMRIWYEF